MNIDLVTDIKSDVKVEFLDSATLKEHKQYKKLKKVTFCKIIKTNRSEVYLWLESYLYLHDQIGLQL